MNSWIRSHHVPNRKLVIGLPGVHQHEKESLTAFVHFSMLGCSAKLSSS